jgi:hypothetical protein
MSRQFALVLLFSIFPGIFTYSQKDTTIVNIQQINSASDDYLPFLVDSTLFFTSNRKNTREDQILEISEKVYYSVKKYGDWYPPKKMGYKWNSDNNTALVGISPDFYFFYRSYWRDNGEIFIAKHSSSDTIAWKAFKLSKLTSICSDFDENSATGVRGDTIFFVSNRNGNYDIFMQIGENNPVSIDSINSEYNDEDVFLANDSKTLYFSSDRPEGKGGFDIYQSNNINNHFTKPVLLQIKGVNSVSDDRDFRKYNDSVMFFSSDRKGGLGGFDIYRISIPENVQKKSNRDSVTIVDTVPRIKPRNITLKNIKPIIISIEQKNTKSDSGIVTLNKILKYPSDTFSNGENLKVLREELINELNNFIHAPSKFEIQLGAYRFIKNLKAFTQKFPCIDNEDIRVDQQKVDTIIVYKFIINKTYTDINLAIEMQYKIINYHCLPEKNFADMPFIALIDENNNRFAIFWKYDEFINKKIFYIFENGKQVWKSKRF